MKILVTGLLVAGFCHAGKILNCHTDSQKVSAKNYRSFDMSLSMTDSNVFKEGGKLYINTFPEHPVDPNPFFKVKTEDVEIKDSLGGEKDLMVYFRAGDNNYVLDMARSSAEKFEGTLRVQGPERMTLAARCYLFPLYP